MNVSILRRAAIIVFCSLLPLPALCQQTEADTTYHSNSGDKKQTKIGLALSGGGAKGFAHIGVLKVLEEENIPIHVVSGTSMGSIVGSLYAIGYTPSEIEQIVLQTDWDILFNDSYRINPRNIASSISSKDTYWFTFPFENSRLNLPAGLIDGQNISMLLYRLMLPYHDVEDFRNLPIPFAAVATDLATGEARTFTGGYLPDVVRASSAIPTIFKPVEIDQKTYIDGGIARNLPAEDSRKLGADLVLASDVGDPVKPVDSLDTFVDVLFQSVGFHQQESDQRQKKISDFYIRPDMSEFSSFSYDRAAEIIAQGEKAARKIIPRLRARLSDGQLADAQFRPISSRQNDTLFVSEVSYSNISGVLEKQTSLALNIDPPARLTLADIESKINKLYSSNFYSQISYRLQQRPTSAGKRLILEFQKKGQEYAGFSVRYDSEYRAALLFGLSITDNLMAGDRLTTQLRVGEVLELRSLYRSPITLAPLSNANMELNFQRSPIDIYNRQQAVSTIEVETISLRPHLSVNFLDALDLRTGIEAEFYNLDEAVGNTFVLENTNLLLKPFAELELNTLNRPYFPTAGQKLHALGEISDRSWGSSSTFLQLTGKWFATIPLLGGINLQNTVVGGYSSTSGLPLHYNYYLGGMPLNPVFNLRQHPFMGHAIQQLRASNLWALRTELQFSLPSSLYLKAGLNAAHLSDKWTLNFDPNRTEYGYAMSLGANTFFGPLELSLSTPDLEGGYAVKIDIGYRF